MATHDQNDAPEPPDLRGPAIIVEGSVIGGFTFYGPFPTIDAAAKHWQGTLAAKLGGGCSIALLDPPEKLPAASPDFPNLTVDDLMGGPA